MRRVVFGLMCVVLVAGVAHSDGPRVGDISKPLVGQSIEVGPLRTVPKVDREALKVENERLHAWLMAEQVVAGIERPLSVQLSAKDFAEIEFATSEGFAETPEALRVGVVKPVGAAFALSDISFGAEARTPEGGRVWSAALRSEGAFGVRIYFDNFWLPPDTELYLFNEAGKVAGPYMGAGPFDTGEFWSHMVFGETIYLQLRQFGPSGVGRLHETYFDIVEVGHVGRQMAARLSDFTKTFCDYNAGCVVNAECYSEVTVVDDARNAVAHMQYVKRPYLYVCSGGLLNNSAEDGTPYFLTANHCISRDREAETLETYFQWTVTCGGACPTQWDDPVGVPSMLGSSVVATNKTSDYSLLLLDGQVPPGVGFLGWTNTEVAYADGETLYRISHPAAAPQAYSTHDVDTGAGTCSSWPRGSWIYSRDVVGATQGGSSGSPVVNGEGLVVGQLSGACGTNLTDDCDAVNNATVDGAFASYYGEVAPWLNPADCDDADNDGYTDSACGGMDCDDTDFWINPGVTEDCENGFDDNCDGLIDDADPDCQICAPSGADCATNADCCSGRCHPRKLFCR